MVKVIGECSCTDCNEGYAQVLLTDRSPWSNEYDPPLDDGTVPSAKLRKLEVTANDAFDTYREMYARTLTFSIDKTHPTSGITRAVFRLCSSGISKMGALLVSSF